MSTLPVPHEPPDESSQDGPAGGARAPPGEGGEVGVDAVKPAEGRDQTGVAGRTAGQPGCRGEIVLRADVNPPVSLHPGRALSPGCLSDGLQTGGQPASAGALLHSVQPDPVGEEVLAGHDARLGVHLLTAQGNAHRVVDWQNESFIPLSPCNESGVSIKTVKPGRELQYLMTAMLTGAVQVTMGELAAMLAPSL